LTLVVDASFIVAALVDSHEPGEWALRVLRSDQPVAPHLMPAEVSNILRRAVLRGDVAPADADMAHGELLAMRIVLYPFGPFGDRVWQLRHTVTPYDAWYVALAEALEAPLASLDGKLASAPGPLCQFVTFGG
jgi:predicted nucleic acid-binding protein